MPDLRFAAARLAAERHPCPDCESERGDTCTNLATGQALARLPAHDARIKAARRFATELRRAAELADTTGGLTLRAVMHITGAGPLRAAELIDELQRRGIVEQGATGRYVATDTVLIAPAGLDQGGWS